MGGLDASAEVTWNLAAQFEAQAFRTPNAVALTFADDAVRYAELDEQANRLAWQLAVTSIDDGHTALHLSIDFMTASQLTSPFGVIVVDVLFHPDWPGVTEGIFRVLSQKESPFVPLFITRKKAFFCHASVQKRFVAFIAEQFSARYARDVRYVDFFGWRVPSLNFGSEY